MNVFSFWSEFSGRVGWRIWANNHMSVITWYLLRNSSIVLGVDDMNRRFVWIVSVLTKWTHLTADLWL